jgi:hypothetical protein
MVEVDQNVGEVGGVLVGFDEVTHKYTYSTVVMIRRRGHRWFVVPQSIVLPTDFHKAAEIVDCLKETFDKVREINAQLTMEEK